MPRTKGGGRNPSELAFSFHLYSALFVFAHDSITCRDNKPTDGKKAWEAARTTDGKTICWHVDMWSRFDDIFDEGLRGEPPELDVDDPTTIL